MPNATLLYRNRLDEGGTLTTTAEVSTLPVSNVLDEHVGTVFRSPVDAARLRFDAGTPVTAQQVFLAGLSASTVTRFLVRASDIAVGNDELGLLDTNAGVTSPQFYAFDDLHRHVLADFGSEITARFWEIFVQSSGAASFDIGRAVLGPILPVTRNISYPLETDRVRNSRIFRGLAGASTVYRRPDQRVYNFTWEGSLITEADLYQTIERDLDHHVSNAGQVVFTPALSADPLGVRHACLGRLDPGVGVYSGINQLGRSFRITESL